MTALFIGTALAVASLCFVLYPLFRSDLSLAKPIRRSPVVRERQSSAVEALRELEFDRETGKISDADYDSLKARYTDQALTVMRAGEGHGGGVVRVCEQCGPRPEPDADFCSKCGAVLPS